MHRRMVGPAVCAAVVVGLGVLAAPSSSFASTSLRAATAGCTIYDKWGATVAWGRGSCAVSGAGIGGAAATGGGGSATFMAGDDPTYNGVAGAVYQIAVDGQPQTLVPLVMTGLTTVERTGAWATVTVTDDSGRSVIARECFGLSHPGCDAAGSFRITFNAMSDLPMTVTVSASGQGGDNGSATIDPQIFIDPKFAGADQFTVIASPGVFSSGAPEPAVWTSLLAGFFGLGALLRRRLLIAA